MKHYTNDELQAMIDAADEEGDSEVRDTLRGILDIREADAYAEAEDE